MNRRLPPFLRSGDPPSSPETEPASSDERQDAAPPAPVLGVPPVPPVPPIPPAGAAEPGAGPVTTMWTVPQTPPPPADAAPADRPMFDALPPADDAATADDSPSGPEDAHDGPHPGQDADADETPRLLPRTDTKTGADDTPSLLPDHDAPADTAATSIWSVPLQQASPPAAGSTASRPVATTPGAQPTTAPDPAAPSPAVPFAEPAGASGAPLPADVAPQTADAPSYRDRSRFRRRLRYLRRVRELGFRDLGGLIFDLYRFERSGEDLVRAKLVALEAVDRELRALERVMKDERAFTDLREPGIAACTRCGALHGSDARFCPSCGVSVSGPTTLSEVPVAASSTPAGAGAAGPIEPGAPAAGPHAGRGDAVPGGPEDGGR